MLGAGANPFEEDSVWKFSAAVVLDLTGRGGAATEAEAEANDGLADQGVPSPGAEVGDVALE